MSSATSSRAPARAGRRRRGGFGAAALAFAFACGGPPEPQGRVLVVGLDGASPRVVEPLLAAGRLPHLARLAEEGTWGPLRSIAPIDSPPVWNSVATGKLPIKHGVLGFDRPAEDGGRRLYLSTDRTTHALWNIASRAGLEVGVVNWWNTYPPERIRGVMVSDHLFPREVQARRQLTGARRPPQRPLAWPLDWQARLAGLVDGDALAALRLAHPLREASGLPHWVELDELLLWTREDAVLTRVAVAVDDALRPDLLLVLLTGVDRISHFLWIGVEEPGAYPEERRLDAPTRRAARAALEAYYAYADALVGRLLERYGPGDLVLVLSDHGFEAGQAAGFLTGVHETEQALDGVLFARGPGIAAGAPAAGTSVLDVAPTLLAWLGLPAGRDMDGRVAAFLDAQPPAPVATWDTEPIARLDAPPSGAEAALLEELRALGYVE